MSPAISEWRRRHSNAGLTMYSVLLFGCALFVLGNAWQAGSFVLHGINGLLIGAGSYLLAIFIILLGFTTPRGAYVSLDRITQVGLILAFSPADAALINGLASFTYPLIAQRAQYGLGMAFVRSLHNSAMFSLMIYGAGQAYLACGGAIPVMELNAHTLFAFGALVVIMQIINSLFLHMRGVAMAVPRPLAPDWYSHAIEVPVALCGLLTALIYNNMSTSVIALFLLLLAGVSVIAKSLNAVTLALKEQKDTLEQKVLERVAEIEEQKVELTKMNVNQQELLASLRSTTAELERQNREDALTGLYNRRHMNEFLSREFERAQRQNSPMSIALIDVDRFKQINDQFSHQVGDATLQALGVIIPASVRALDLVARYGGEEIFLCMPDTLLDEAVAVCERARVQIEAYPWSTIAPGLRVTASFGVVQCTADTLASQLARCDDMLYQAKHQGRNRVCY